MSSIVNYCFIKLFFTVYFLFKYIIIKVRFYDKTNITMAIEWIYFITKNCTQKKKKNRKKDTFFLFLLCKSVHKMWMKCILELYIFQIF